jgi:hypothetical protein
VHGLAVGLDVGAAPACVGRPTPVARLSTASSGSKKRERKRVRFTVFLVVWMVR